jgi:hypothetical protein
VGDILKGLAALVLVVAAFRWAVATVVDKAIANSDGTASGFKFETTPLVIPETNFNWNANWNLNPGVTSLQGDGGTEQEPAAATHSHPSDRSPSNDAATARQREMREQVREMHQAIRNSSDPKAEMERIRARMRERQTGR